MQTNSVLCSKNQNKRHIKNEKKNSLYYCQLRTIISSKFQNKYQAYKVYKDENQLKYR